MAKKKESQEVAQVFAPRYIIQSLVSMFELSREPSRGLRKKIDDFEKKAQESLAGAIEEHQKIQAFYALEELKEGQSIPKEALDKLNKVYMKDSTLSRSAAQFLSETEFDKCFPYEDNVLSRGDRKMLEYWTVLEEKE